MRVSFLEIYNEVINDLLTNGPAPVSSLRAQHSLTSTCLSVCLSVCRLCVSVVSQCLMHVFFHALRRRWFG